MKWELHAIVKGKVQGVGFRWTVVDHAERFGLTGTVQNLSNGSVEIIAQGSDENLKQFLAAIQESPGNASIIAVTSRIIPVTTILINFKIL